MFYRAEIDEVEQGGGCGIYGIVEFSPLEILQPNGFDESRRALQVLKRTWAP